MGATTVDPEVEAFLAGADDDDLVHVACDCTPDTGLCGADTSGGDWLDDEDVPLAEVCVVCGDLIGIPCPKCGG